VYENSSIAKLNDLIYARLLSKTVSMGSGDGVKW